jgi:ribokinase
MKGPIVVFGSLNADIVVRLPHFPAPGETVTGTDLAVFPGGKGANQACAAARLGARVHMVGRVGADGNGQLLRSSLDNAGVDTSALLADASVPTGTAFIAIDATGQNEIVIVGGANGRVGTDDVERSRSLIEGAAFLLLQLEVPLAAVEAAARVARAAGRTVILDPAPSQAAALSLLPLVDYVTPNESELLGLCGERVRGIDLEEAAALGRRLVERGARRVVAKLGPLGTMLVTKDVVRRWSGLAVRAVDTTAAGDVWAGAFATALSEGAREDKAGAFANVAAGISVTRAGAQPSMPDRAEVEARLGWRLEAQGEEG